MKTSSTGPKTDQTSLLDLALLFLRLGTTAFGGPAAHIAMMEDEVVRRRRWMTHEEFLDLLGATNLIPGPNSTEMAIHIGHRQAGWLGLLIAGVSFILPAVLIVTAFAWAYVRYGSLPQVAGLLYGVKPVIIAIVLQALWSLGRAAIKSTFLALVAVAGVALTIVGVHELLVLFGAGVIVGSGRLIARPIGTRHNLFLPISGSPVALFLQASTAVTAPFGLWPLFLFFLKVGSVLYGSGYVLLAFIRADLVERWHWLTDQHPHRQYSEDDLLCLGPYKQVASIHLCTGMQAADGLPHARAMMQPQFGLTRKRSAMPISFPECYGGVFVVLSILWGWLVDKITPDRFDLIGGAVALAENVRATSFNDRQISLYDRQISFNDRTHSNVGSVISEIRPLLESTTYEDSSGITCNFPHRPITHIEITEDASHFEMPSCRDHWKHLARA